MSHPSDSTSGYSRFSEDMTSAINDDSITTDYSIINKGEEDQYECHGYRRHACMLFLTCLLVLLTCGLFLLVLYWKPDWRVKLTHVRCSLSVADTIILLDSFDGIHPEVIVNREISNGLPRYSGQLLPGRIGDAFLYTEADRRQHDDTTALNIHQRIFLRYFEHRHQRYMWDKSARTFSKLFGLDSGLTCAVIHDKFGSGLKEAEQAYKIELYGDNSIVISVKSYWRLFIEEVINPFYIFQIASIILWSLDEYMVYAASIFIISAISLSVELYETRKQSVTLHDMVVSLETTVHVVRAGIEMEVPTTTLVPGDVMIIPPRGCVMNCDAVLLSGNAIVNESMLTGESVPVTKTPLSPSEADEIYTPDSHKRHTLFCGTHVIQTRYYGDQQVKAVIIRTGFSTAKGELVRSILYPKPVGFQFYRDSIKFICILSLFAVIGMAYSTVMFISNGVTTKEVVLRALDIVTIVVPPALPAAMTVGTIYAQARLKKSGIFCISPPRINICGKLKCICFDKTGTLTEEGLDMWGVIPMQDKRFQHAVQNVPDLPVRGAFITAMATCHSLTRIEGEVTGDPLDLKMFNSTNWLLQEPGKDSSKFDTFVPTSVKPITKETYDDDNDLIPFEVGIVRQFTFSSNLQRMSVVTRVLGSTHMDVYVKGAPEMIASLCKRNTLPDDFHDVLQRYTIRGFRVIAMAYKKLDKKVTWHSVQRVPRDQIEDELSFLGLMVMENMLKPETTPVIKQLKEADIRTVMVTGDNMLTAISVARQCSMIDTQQPVILVNAYPAEGVKAARIEWGVADIQPDELLEQSAETAGPDGDAGEGTQTSRDTAQLYSTTVSVESDRPRYHFALTGRSFAVIRNDFPELLNRMLVRGTVFARMSPDQKSQLVEGLQELGYGVGMCGDGANDCGALKAAHAGISLSEAEASVASPFTSKTANIECVPTVIREGRAALVTSFGVFKYMALYSIIQFVSVLILYTKLVNFGDWQYLFIDLFITSTVAIFSKY